MRLNFKAKTLKQMHGGLSAGGLIFFYGIGSAKGRIFGFAQSVLRHEFYILELVPQQKGAEFLQIVRSVIIPGDQRHPDAQWKTHIPEPGRVLQYHIVADACFCAVRFWIHMLYIHKQHIQLGQNLFERRPWSKTTGLYTGMKAQG